MLMNNFYNKLESYINKHGEDKLSPAFKYDIDTIISPEIAMGIYLTCQQLFSIQQLWEKEKDYSRLLKKENNELREELSYYEASEEDEYEDPDFIEPKEEEYLS